MRSRIWESYRGLPVSVYVLSGGELINSAGNFVNPFITLLMTQVLGYSAARAGLIMTMVLAIGAPTGMALGGKLSDTIGRKNTMRLTFGGKIICYIICTALGQSEAIIGLLGLAVFFSAASSFCVASVMMDITNQDNRKASYSLQYLSRNLGFAIGPFIAGFLFYRCLPLLFIGDAVTTLIMLVLILKYVPESKPTIAEIQLSMETETGMEKAEQGSLIQVLKLRSILIYFALVRIFYELILSQINYGLPLQMSALFGRTGPEWYGTVMMVNGLGVVLMTPLISILTSKQHNLINLTMAGGLFAIGFGLTGLLTIPLHFIIAAIVWTAGEILMTVNVNEYVANHTPRSHRGRVIGVIHLISGSGFAISPLLTGRLVSNIGISRIWPFVGASGLIGALGMIGMFHFERHRMNHQHRVVQGG